VKERTAELDGTKKLFVNRETRMAELKATIRESENKLRDRKAA
jgi:hypothetical protein